MRRLMLLAVLLPSLSGLVWVVSCERDNYREELPLRPIGDENASPSPDMAAAPDMTQTAPPPDLRSPADLAAAPDLAVQPDLASRPDGGGDM